RRRSAGVRGAGRPRGRADVQPAWRPRRAARADVRRVVEAQPGAGLLLAVGVRPDRTACLQACVRLRLASAGGVDEPDRRSGGPAKGRFWPPLCAVLELEALAGDPRFASMAARFEHRDTLVPILRERVLTRTADDWVARLEAADVPTAPVLGLAEALADDQVAA